MRLTCTVGELRKRLGSAEFGHWMAFFELEPREVDTALPLWAGLMAALHNGPMLKKSKAAWSAADFLPRAAPAPCKAPSTAELKAHVAALKRKG